MYWYYNSTKRERGRTADGADRPPPTLNERSRRARGVTSPTSFENKAIYTMHSLSFCGLNTPIRIIPHDFESEHLLEIRLERPGARILNRIKKAIRHKEIITGGVTFGPRLSDHVAMRFRFKKQTENSAVLEIEHASYFDGQKFCKLTGYDASVLLPRLGAKSEFVVG